jgi:hypothetical protein
MSVSDTNMNTMNEMKAIVVSLNNSKTRVKDLFSETKFGITTTEIQNVCVGIETLITTLDGFYSRIENYKPEPVQESNDPVLVASVPKPKRVYKKKVPKTDTSTVDADCSDQVKTPKAKLPKNSKVVKPAFILPFTGVIEENKCHSIRYNYGLHTQCQNKKLKSGDYCSLCQKNIKQTSDNKPPSGDIRDRLNVPLLEYVDPKGKKTVPYIKVISKLKVTREQAEEEAKKFGFTIPDEHWVEVTKSKATKAKAAKAKAHTDVKPTAADTETSTTIDKDTQSNKRGRPVKPVVSIDETSVLVSDMKEEIQSIVNANGTNTEVKEEEESEDIQCEEFEINNQTYLRSSDNKIYDINTEEYIGKYNPSTNEIVL